jgi:5-methylcytosine-specific restriction protein A
MTIARAKRLYGRQWERARSLYLTLNPYCCMCAEQGRVTVANVVDHITPHRGDLALFWDEENWASLCKLHHDSAKQAEEKRGYIIGSDVRGMPIDPQHPWYRDGGRS